MAARREQKGKDGKRQRRFHRGLAQGVINDRLLRDVLEPAYAAAEADSVEVAAVSASHRRDQADYADCLRQLERAAPFAPAGFPLVLGSRSASRRMVRRLGGGARPPL